MEGAMYEPRAERISTARSPVLRKIKQQAYLGVKRVRYLLKPEPAPRNHMLATPYFPQWESPEMVAGIVQGKLCAQDDPNWRESGAVTQDEYAFWSFACCGMACLKMALARRTGQVHQTVALAHQAEGYGGYVSDGTAIDGLYYKPFCQYLKERFGLVARSVPALHPREIILAIAQGRDVLLSVTPKIRFPNERPATQGGHLVLAVGYDLDKGLLYIHNPSGYRGESQVAAPVSLKNLKHFFDYKGIVIG